MMLDLKKGLPIAIVVYYNDKDYNEDTAWTQIFYSEDKLKEWENEMNEIQPYTGYNWFVYRL